MNKLYRRNNNGAPTVWWAELDSGTNSITVFYGLVRGNIRKEVYAVSQSRYYADEVYKFHVEY